MWTATSATSRWARSLCVPPATARGWIAPCPLRCPGCYAYGDDHLGGGVVLRELADYKGQELVDGVIDMVRRMLQEPSEGH